MTSMDTQNGRRGSEAPSSSSSDFYATDSPKKQPHQAPAVDDPRQPDALDGLIDEEDDDSSVDMEISDSRSPSPAPPTNGTSQPEQRADAATIHPTPKRKLSEEDTSANGIAQTAAEGAKRPKLSTTCSESSNGRTVSALDLPVALWQQIFVHLSPNNLARCLRVCRTLKYYLTETKATATTNKAQAKDFSKIREFDSEAIWVHARKTFHPNMPRPLARLTELQMLQLIGNKKCQFCDRPPVPLCPTSPFNCGPGLEGVRVIWSFGIRSCGRCIEENTLKDIDVLTSKAGSLRNGLPHCFLTPDLHFVPDIQRTQPGGIPSHLRVAKVYYNLDVQKIVEEQNDAVSFGLGAAEEWKKGLPARGKEAMADAARWEQWEGQMPAGTDLSQLLSEYDASHSTSVGQAYQAYSSAAVPNGMQPAMAMNGSYPPGTSVPLPHPLPFSQPAHLPQPVFMQQSNAPGLLYASQPTYALPSKPAKAARTAQDVEEALRARRADIERRCRELSPPLDPGALPHMASFSATMQIAQPMTDEFWESFLKPRILTERDAAEAAERMRQDHMVWLQAAVPHSAHDEPFSRPAKEVYDKDFEDAQEPLRRNLSEYADDFINNHWRGGQLDKTNSPVFAVKVIEFVDRRYREDKLAGVLPQPEQSSRGTKQGSPMPDPFLSLHNMKWVYDNKIRPRTDVHGRELFLCSGCTDSKQPKWLAFEGLIQHYGAKHTTAFSQGNVVVHWQTAEWPSELPFVRDPTYYMKHEKKMTDAKGHGRARRTPQTNITPFNAPSNEKLLSDTPVFSRQHGSHPAALAYYHPQYNVYLHDEPQSAYGWPQQIAASNEQHSESTYEAQLNVLSGEISATWDSLDGVKEDVLLPCIRIQASLHHAVGSFEATFGKIPNLDHITDVLVTKPDVKAVKEAKGLACQLCVAAQTDGSASYSGYYGRIQNVKLYNTSSLVSHFSAVHLSQNRGLSSDWIAKMIELPEPEMIGRLLRAPGMDDTKLSILAAAFPNAFPYPLPKIGFVAEEQPENLLAQKMLDRHFKKKSEPPKKKRKGQHGANGTPAREESEPLPEARDDEYDPRRPMALPIPTGTSPTSATAFNFAPETLAALSQLNACSVQSGQHDNRTERSPSVGRAEPAKHPVPDISHILAQLTGQAQSISTESQHVATPPDTSTSRGSSQPKHFFHDPYSHQSQTASPHRYADDRPTSSRYPPQPQQAYRPSAEPPLAARRDDQARDTYERPVQAYNAQHFEHNRAQPYAEQAYPQTQPRSPPQPQPHYRPIYARHTPTPPQQQQYAHPAAASPPAFAPTYRPEYVQVPAYPDRDRDRDRYAPSQPLQYAHAHSPPQPQPKYVDAHGRELRLVPMPLQYGVVPHVLEQQYAPAPAAAAGYASSPPAPQHAPQYAAQYSTQFAHYPYEEGRAEQVFYAAAPRQYEQGFGFENGRGDVVRR